MNGMKSHFLIAALALAPLLATAAESVTVRPFSDVAIFLDRQAAATAESLDEVTLAAEISARVAELRALPGQTVEAGELLVRLEEREYRIGVDSAGARLAMAEAALDMARIRAERARRLAPDRFVSEDQLLEAETNLRLAEADRAAARSDLDRAELMLSRTRIEAPFTAAVTRKLVSPGTLAAPGTPLLELIASADIEVRAMIPPDQVDGLEAADSLTFQSGSRSWPLRLERVAPVISRGSRGREARLVFVDDPAPAGSEGRLRWTDPKPALPGDFVQLRDGVLGVLILDEDGTHAAFHELPGADAGRPYLPPDLAADTLLIDEGRRRVGPGDRVDPSSR
ncbi:MAG: efflux RND transporter periplasmic adaptor subunit [Wenzhouxiangella sp.]|nr:MAG: efflux RND transporter periplasmic adaptor subunit [Wenzhouxiangella sp.]